jgi:hypothetical protein
VIKEYLLKRKSILEEKIEKNTERLEHNQIAIAELENQIKELNETIDEASQIFSVIAREEGNFRKNEILEFENNISFYQEENRTYEEIIRTTQKELEEVENCLNDLETNVSRETLEKTKEDYQVKHKEIYSENGDDNKNLENKEQTYDYKLNCKNILEKLKLCKSIAEIDGKRVKIEIDNLIKIMEE